MKFGGLGFTNHKVVFAHFDLLNIDSSHFFKQLQTLIAYISRTDRNIDKRKTAFTTTIDSTTNAEKLLSLGLQTTKFCCLIPNHPSLALHLLYTYMTTQLCLGHVTLLRTKFQPLNCPPIGLMVPGGLMLGSAPYF